MQINLVHDLYVHEKRGTYGSPCEWYDVKSLTLTIYIYLKFYCMWISFSFNLSISFPWCSPKVLLVLTWIRHLNLFSTHHNMLLFLYVHPFLKQTHSRRNCLPVKSLIICQVFNLWEANLYLTGFGTLHEVFVLWF